MVDRTRSFFVVVVMAIILIGGAPAGAQYTARSDYHAPLEPIGSIVHGAGQEPSWDIDSFPEYVDTMDAGEKPVIYMVYDSIHTVSDGSVKDIYDTIRVYDDLYMVFQSGLNFTYDNTDGTNNFVDGKHDTQMLATFDHFHSANRPTYFRFGYECNGFWNDWSTNTYKKAFRRATLAMRDEGIEGAALWNVYPFSGWEVYNPGATYADWYSIDVFSNSENLGSVTTGFVSAAQSAGRAVLVGEATPRYVGADDDSDWNNWFVNNFALYKNYANVKGHAYINWNWAETRPDWSTWGDARLNTGSSLVRNNYRNEMSNSVWLHAQSEEDMRAALGLAEVFVDAAATGAGDGTSWEDAFLEIGPAISALVSAHGRGLVRVAQGIYSGGISVPDGVQLWGGYPSGGAVDRDHTRYPSIIDGGGSQRCVTLAGTFSMIRGFTIRNGSANQGGGVYVDGKDATVYHCTIRDNAASDQGGGIYVRRDRARIAGCIIRGNTATNSGGGVYLNGALESIVYNSVLHDNTAASGAGLFVLGPGVVLDSCTIAHHQGSGAALAANHSGGTTTDVVEMRNCIIASNQPSAEAYAVETLSATTGARFYSCLFYDTPSDNFYGGSGTETISKPCITGQNPQFVNAAGRDYRLSSSSPAIDLDQPDSYGLATLLAFDICSDERGIDGDGNGTKGYDLGAYEYQLRDSLTLDSAGGIWGVGPEGGPFKATRTRYLLQNHTGAALDWSIAEQPDWLEASVGSGGLAAGEEIEVWLSFTSQARALSAGEYVGTDLVFRDETNAVDVARKVRMFVSYGGLRILDSYPPPDGYVLGFESVQVLFNEVVLGVDAADLTVNGVPATTVTGTGAGPYRFSGFPPVVSGTADVVLDAGGITSSETGAAYTGDAWQVHYMSFKTGIRAWREYE